MSPSAGEQLLERARVFLSVLRAQARRAFVIELMGTPKAGKSTSVVALQTFFKEAGYQVHVLKERAADCPLPMKGHFFFNAWTTATMLAEVLETHETNVDLLILDRGFFDALVWLELQARRDQVTSEEKKIFADFVLLERWRSLVDVTLVMTVTPPKALQREHKDQIVKRTGSLMNEAALTEFNNALDHVVEEYGSRFSHIRYDTTEATSVVETNVELLDQLLGRLEAWADPPIAVVQRVHVIDVFGAKPFLHAEEARSALDTLAGKVEFCKRSEAERDGALVQFIAAGIHTHRNGILILAREPRAEKATSYGRHTLWIGCHIDEKGPLLDSAVTCLNRRIQQDLHISTKPALELLGLAWDQSQSETRHLGIMFRAPIANDYVAKHLKDKQFKKMGRAGKLKSVFLSLDEILMNLRTLDLEPWSEHMARNIKLNKDDGQ